MMQNTSATDPRGVSLEAEIRFTRYRLDTTSDISSRLSALGRLHLLQDVLAGMTTITTPAPTPQPKPRNWGGV